MDENQQKIATEKGIFSLWYNWTLSSGALVLLVILSLFISKLWLPIVALALVAIMSVWIRLSSQSNGKGQCRLIPWMVMKVLFYSGILMLIIDVFYFRGFASRMFDDEFINLIHPYITVLVLGPVAVVVSLVAMIREKDCGICQDCIIRYGTVIERGYIGRILTQESRYQLKYFFGLSLVIALESWIYYVLFYINVNLNGNDHFFYHWLPVIIWGLSVIYMGTRYLGLWGYYYGTSSRSETVSRTITDVRFLVMTNDSIFLGRSDEFPDNPVESMIDTPTTVILSSGGNVTLGEATKMFENLTEVSGKDFRIRTMYESRDITGICRLYHFIVTLTDPALMEKSSLKGEWYTIPQIQRLIAAGELSPMLSAEIDRLYTITMMWKTYSREGKRLYKIKNYSPNFRIDGIQDWDVDFNDPHWLYVARINEDKPFFKLRRWWSKYITGSKYR